MTFWTQRIAILLLIIMHFISLAQAGSQQVIYRYDENRFLVLVGQRCQGALWYVDSKRNIKTEVLSGSYKVFAKPYIHPSERYIAITDYASSFFLVSRDYGEHFDIVRYSPGGGAEEYKDFKPLPEDVLSFTVVNDQGFILTKQGYIYASSKPFGDGWGLKYMALNAIPRLVFRDYPHFQNMPTSVPEVKDYKGWTHMQCDPSL